MNVRKQLKSVYKDYESRSYLFAELSLFTTFVFLAYNFVLGVRYQAIWNFSISFYYMVLLGLRTIMIAGEKRSRHDEMKTRQQEQLRLFRLTTKILLLMDFALIVPITLMVMSRRSVNIGMVPAIGIAAYTTYKIIFAAIHYFKTRGQKNLALFGLKIINLKDAIVSILTLQNTMVMVFGNSASMQTFTAYTSAGISIGMLVMTVLLIRKGVQYSEGMDAS